MLSSLPSEVVSLICSFSDANTFRSFTLTNSAYNQNQSLYQEYIMKNYSPELFGFPVWDHTIFENKGFLPNGKNPRENFSFPGPKGACHNLNYPAKKLGQFSAQREALQWKDLFYRINSKKYLNICGTERKFPIYFSETLLNIVQRANETCDKDKFHHYLLYDPIGKYLLVVSKSLQGSGSSYKYNNDMQIQFFEFHQMISVLGSIITDGNYLFDRLSVIGSNLISTVDP
jgi:hypothetical protein